MEHKHKVEPKLYVGRTEYILNIFLLIFNFFFILNDIIVNRVHGVETH